MRNRLYLFTVATALMVQSTILAQSTPATSAPASGPATAPQVVPPAAPVDPTEAWIQKTKNPCPWLTWGADERLRNEWAKNYKTLNDDLPRQNYEFGRFRTRLWTTVKPCKDFEINARAVWEWRVYGEPEGLRDVELNEVIFDNLNFVWKNIGGLPLKATIGRQDIILGDGWLVLDGTPLDGSRTIFFDAARLTYEHKPSKTTIDGIYIDQAAREDRWIEPFNHQTEVLAVNGAGKIVTKPNLLMEQNERGAILWVANKSLERNELDGYFIYKRDEPLEQTGGGRVNNIYTYGIRDVKEFNDNWRARAELAQQLGHRGRQDICALGFKSLVEYFFRDKYANSLRGGYEFLSGDNPNSKKNEGFDPLWGRWPQWSEIYANTIAVDTGKPAFWSNLHRIQVGHTFKPCAKMEIATDYHLLWRNQPVVGKSGIDPNEEFRGQMLTWLAKYKFNDHVSTHFLFEYFMPGNFYETPRGDPALYWRYELVFTW